MILSRRSFIAASACVMLPRISVAQNANEFTLTAEKATLPLLGPEQPRTDILTFDKANPASVVRIRQNQLARCKIVNKLDEELALHWYGMRLPAAVSSVFVEAGKTLDIEFTPPDAGTFWFGTSRSQSRLRDSGLYGMLIVDAADITASPFHDYPMIFDDWMIDEAGKLDSNFGNMERAIAEGRMGNWYTVNGVAKPTITFFRDKPTRLRILNAANMRTFNLFIKNADVAIVARDGQPTWFQLVEQKDIPLEPGQTVDLLAVPTADLATVNVNLFEDQIEAAVLSTDGSGAFPKLPSAFALPANPVPAFAVGQTLALVLEGGAKGGLKQAKLGTEILDLRGLIEQKQAWAMNGIAGPDGDQLFTASKGQTLFIGVTNKTNFGQTLYVSGHVWRRVLDQNTANEQPSLRSTVSVAKGETVKLEMVADNPGKWFIQSTRAEWADAGLVGSFTVSETP